MAKTDDSGWASARAPVSNGDHGEFERPKGWKYRSLRIGPIKLPCYASPESQLILVSFVCFLCPGKQHKIVVTHSLLTLRRHVQRRQWYRSRRSRRRCTCQQRCEYYTLCYLRNCRFLRWHHHQCPRYSSCAFLRRSGVLRLRQCIALLQQNSKLGLRRLLWVLIRLLRWHTMVGARCHNVS